MWQVEINRGSADTFHQRTIPEVVAPAVWWFEVQTSALVLGSSQSIGQIDQRACDAAGVEVVRRRSGGGAVLLQPGDVMWVDVLLPSHDRRWRQDIGCSAWWLGEVWQAALASVGVDGTEVHRERMIHTAWSGHVCFAGVGGGEVMRDGRKVVGISQRRTRAGARFQCALYRRWSPEAHAALFEAGGPTAADLADLAVEVDLDPVTVMSAFEIALTAS